MSGTILTPNAIWNNFYIPDELGAEIFNERKVDGVIFEDVHIEGRKIGDETVNIYALLARKKKDVQGPAILLLQNFHNCNNETLILDLVKKGYAVLSVDIAGEKEGKENFTVYPEAIKYARYEEAKEELYSVKDDAKKTCWYEWGATTRYALKFLKDLQGVTKVGGFAVAEVATVLWQVAGMDSNLDCAVFALNAGWAGYRGINKFGGKVEPQFSDNMYKFIAGIEPQAYAMHVKCPTLLLSATNDNFYDVDRAYDTVSRIDDNVYKAVHYSIGFRGRLNVKSYKSACIFLEEFLLKSSEKVSLPSEIDLTCEIVNGELVVSATLEEKALKGIELYVAEEMIAPETRCWERVTEYKKADGKFIFTYNPYHLSEIATMFIHATYKNGFETSSNIIAKRFADGEIKKTHQSKIIYSSRIENSDSVFTAVDQTKGNDTEFINVKGQNDVVVKKGPMAIEGVYSKYGLSTFKILEKKYKPMDGAMLMFDAYAKTQGQLTVKLIRDYYGAKTTYVATVNLTGGDVWQNVQLDMNRFKTAEGMVLKSYENISAIEFNVEGVEFLINNALWV